MKAIWKDHVIADAAKDDLIYIEGNWYFPPSSLKVPVVSRKSHASGVQGGGEQRTESYREYDKGAAQPATQQSAASVSGASGSAAGQADAVCLRESDTPYTCPWKGVCQYYDVGNGDDWGRDNAWSYPQPKPSAIDIVKKSSGGKDFSGYVAFYKDRDIKFED